MGRRREQRFQLRSIDGPRAVVTPLTYQVVGFLKRAEHEDYYDVDTDFTPFSIEM